MCILVSFFWGRIAEVLGSGRRGRWIATPPFLPSPFGPGKIVSICFYSLYIFYVIIFLFLSSSYSGHGSCKAASRGMMRKTQDTYDTSTRKTTCGEGHVLFFFFFFLLSYMFRRAIWHERLSFSLCILIYPASPKAGSARVGRANLRVSPHSSQHVAHHRRSQAIGRSDREGRSYETFKPD